jgi:hypothetical protein
VSSLIEKAQADIFGRLSQDAFFTDVSVYLFRPRSEEEAVEIVNNINQSLAGLITKGGKSGIAAVVRLPSANVAEPNIPGPRLRLIYTVRVLENPMINMGSAGTGKSAEDVALVILNLLHHFQAADFGSALFCDGQALVGLDADDQGRIGYDCNVTMNLGLARSTRVNTPAISGTPAGVTITCGTGGADVVYTTDGSYPVIGTGFTGTLYSAPFAVTSGTLVRSVATKSGLQASDLASKTIT